MIKSPGAPALNWLRCLSLGLLSMACSAQAAVYTGVWDPSYGAPFANLGWRGDAQYTVPTSCEPSGTADINNAVDCGGAALVSSAEVVLYDTRSAEKAALATLVFDPLSLSIGTLRYLDGELVELTSGPSNVVNPSADLSSFGVSASTGFFLEFALDGPHLGWVDCARDYDGCQRGSNDGINFAPHFSISRVPEPGSLWLGGLALVALGAFRRRARA